MNTEIGNMSFMTKQFFIVKRNMREVTLPKTMTENDNHQNEITYYLRRK